MEYKILDYRKRSEYKERIKNVRRLAKELDESFNGNVKATYTVTLNNFYVELTPVQPMGVHSFISFVGKVYENANQIMGEKDPREELNEAIKAGAPNPFAAALLGKLMQTVQVKMSGYRIKHLQIVDGSGKLIDTIKENSEETLKLMPLIPKGFNWETASVRVPKD